MADKTSVNSPMNDMLEKRGGGGGQKPLSVNSPMEDMGMGNMTPSGTYNGLKDGPLAAYPRTLGHTGPPEQATVTTTSGKVSINTPMSESDVPRMGGVVPKSDG